MRIAASKLRLLEHRCYYLFGEDYDAILEAADSLLAAGDKHAIRLRLDVSELSRIEEESRNQGLFEPSICYAMVRNAESSSPKQAAHLLQLAEDLANDTESHHRLIICAPNIDWKKALHKKMQALSNVACCEFHIPDEVQFQRWFEQALSQASLSLDDDALHDAVESLCGLRLAARQFIQRLEWYAAHSDEALDKKVVAALLGEHTPEELEDWCHAIAMRDTRAVSLALCLLRNQQVAEVKMLAWLGTRLQQMLMYRWHQSKGERNPLQKAKVFGDARHKLQKEAARWRPSELMDALHQLTEAEKLLKGASVEDKHIVMERITYQLVTIHD